MIEPLIRFADRVRTRFTRPLYREQWVIAFCEKSQLNPLPSKQDHFRVIRPGAHRHYADPFLVLKSEKKYLFFESWCDVNPKGVICCAELQKNGTVSRPAVVLERDYHLSYPCVFEWEGEMFLIPETLRNRTIELYRAVEFPKRWELASVIMKDVSAVDTTICKHDGRLWLFTAGLGGGRSKYRDLYLFHSTSLFGPWTPHPLNPVVANEHAARPAGGIVYDGAQLIRPGQDCSVRYGYAISLNRISTLNDKEYKEVTIGKILPRWLPGLIATHTLSQCDGVQVIDGKLRIR